MLRCCLFVIALLGAGCGSDAPTPPARARPVATTALQRLAPARDLRVTGVASPYREAEVAFEVSGRLIAIVDVGRSVEVRTRPGRDTPLETVGDVIAQIDDTSYRQRLDAAQLRLKTAQSGLAAQRVDLEEVAPATVARAKAQRDAGISQVAASRAGLEAAEAARKKAASDLTRNQKLLNERQISPSEFDQYKSAADTATAEVAKAKAGLQAAQDNASALESAVTEAEAGVRLKAESLAQTQAQIRELAVAVEQAQTDLDRCVLRAPFAGRITYVYASHGDLVSPGKAVLRITLIDPIKISASVSADRERTIKSGNYARVEPKNLSSFREGEAVLFGTVFEKGAVADPSTRTYRIDVMVRNARRLWAPEVGADATRIGFRQLLPAVERNFGEGGPLFVARGCLRDEDGKTFVYRLRGAKFGAPRPSQLFAGRLPLDRIEVQTSSRDDDDYMQILNWTFQRVDAPTLENGDLLLSFAGLDPTKVNPRAVVLETKEWAIRPGELVPIVFPGDPLPEGFWIPDAAIVARNDGRAVFVVKDGRAEEIPVRVHESLGRLRRIEPLGDKRLAVEQAVVVVGAQYLFDGAEVVVAREVDLEDRLAAE